MSKIEVNFLKSEKSWDSNGIDLNKELVAHPTSTYFFKWKENPKKVVVVDRALDLYNGCKVVFLYNREILLGEIRKEFNQIYLKRKEVKYPLNEDIEIWGVVTYLISKI